MRKQSIILVFMIFVNLLSFTAAYASEPYITETKIYLQGELQQFSSPVINYNDRTMVPMRELFEKLGTDVEWNGETQNVTVNTPTKKLVMKIDNHVVHVSVKGIDEKIYTVTDTAPILFNDRTYLPLRFICEQLHLNVVWKEASNSIHLSSKGIVSIGNYSNSTEIGTPSFASLSWNYTGELVDGVANGMGIGEFFLTEGDNLKDSWIDMGYYEDGMCTIDYNQYEDGSYYVGANVFLGTGGFCVEQYSDGYTYIGNRNAQDENEGYGNIFNENGILVYNGEFKNGLLDGYGSLYEHDGTLLYEGEFKENAPSGYGKAFLDGQLLYEGQFKDGIMTDYLEENSNVTAPDINYDVNYSVKVTSFINRPWHLYSYDGKTYLGKITDNKYDADSIWNEYGTYGSKYSANSIWNEYGIYGSAYSLTSAFNPYTTTPPKIVDNNGKLIGYLTANKYVLKAYTIEELYLIVNK